MFRKVEPGTTSRLTIVDHRETYGRHILERMSKVEVGVCVDLGCGHGDDLEIVRKNHPGARCIGIDYGLWNQAELAGRGIEAVSVDIERMPLPFADESVDFVVANQILEHTKEIYWINHQIFRCLKVGGHLFVGVPNVASLHNRILALAGIHPTCGAMLTAHVRVFSRGDLLRYYRTVAGPLVELEDFAGSQFYPFPKWAARPLAAAFPGMAFSIFLLFRKTGPYRGEFLRWITDHVLETNFYRGAEA